MHMVVYRYELKPDMVEAFVEFLEKNVAPLLGKAQGFIKSFTGFDRSTNKVIWVMVGESKEADAIFTETYKNEITQQFAEGARYNSTQPAQEIFEVITEI